MVVLCLQRFLRRLERVVPYSQEEMFLKIGVETKIWNRTRVIEANPAED